MSLALSELFKFWRICCLCCDHGAQVWVGFVCQLILKHLLQQGMHIHSALLQVEPEREMDIDPKGRHFAFYHKDKNKLVVVDLETGKELHNFSQSQNVSQVVYDKKGENLYFFVLPDKIYIHDISKNYSLISLRVNLTMEK